MPNPYFRFKQFTVYHDRCAMKVTTDACLFAAWVARQIKSLNAKSLLDIGTGSGLISLMIAQENKLSIDGVEIDDEAASQAKENILSSPWKESIRIIHHDILDFPEEKKYDVVVSNPPFYENELISASKKRNAAHHSHELSLKELFHCIRVHLKEESHFFLLLPFKREREIKGLANEEGLFINKKLIVRQSVNHQPFRVLVQGSGKNSGPAIETEIAIRDEKQQYTADFVELLKNYYLYL
jgi:tRNA1Val (adenine37-N6)-methyltransferase